MAIISTCYNRFRKADQNGLVTKCFPVCVIHDGSCVLATLQPRINSHNDVT